MAGCEIFNLSITIAVLCVEFGQGVVYAYCRHALVTPPAPFPFSFFNK